jgi:hypothetical protein
MGYESGKTISGWGVVRNSPWHFAGIFETESEAKARAAELGEGYEVHYGDNREGTDDFIWTSAG